MPWTYIDKVHRSFDILCYVHQHHGVTAKEVAESLDLPYGSIYRELDFLVNLGWIHITETRRGNFTSMIVSTRDIDPKEIQFPNPQLSRTYDVTELGTGLASAWVRGGRGRKYYIPSKSMSTQEARSVAQADEGGRELGIEMKELDLEQKLTKEEWKALVHELADYLMDRGVFANSWVYMADKLSRKVHQFAGHDLEGSAFGGCERYPCNLIRAQVTKL